MGAIGRSLSPCTPYVATPSHLAHACYLPTLSLLTAEVDSSLHVVTRRIATVTHSATYHSLQSLLLVEPTRPFTTSTLPTRPSTAINTAHQARHLYYYYYHYPPGPSGSAPCSQGTGRSETQVRRCRHCTCWSGCSSGSGTGYSTGCGAGGGVWCGTRRNSEGGTRCGKRHAPDCSTARSAWSGTRRGTAGGSRCATGMSRAKRRPTLTRLLPAASRPAG